MKGRRWETASVQIGIALLVLLAAGSPSKALIKTAPDRLATASSLEPGQLRPLGAVSPELAAQRNPAGQRSAPTPPAARDPAILAPSRDRWNRLFPAQELGLIEPPDRDQWQPPDQIMDDLNIAEGAVVADIGAGGGWFTIQLARRVAQIGIVYAEDVQQEMLRRRCSAARSGRTWRTSEPCSAAPTTHSCPHGLDAAIIVGRLSRDGVRGEALMRRAGGAPAQRGPIAQTAGPARHRRFLPR